MKYSLQRFEEAHRTHFDTALSEIRSGRKETHWMWFIFPQIRGLGSSSTAKYYALEDLQEAAEFFAHPKLGKNLLTITTALLSLPSNNATLIFGKPDDLKLRSCMTLFSLLPNADPVFQKVINKYFEGKADNRTVELIEEL